MVGALGTQVGGMVYISSWVLNEVIPIQSTGKREINR
jgi:hypothetical protein